jgi:hypothetical protein
MERTLKRAPRVAVFSRQFRYLHAFRLKTYALVNYAIRFSGFMTPSLSAVSGMICQPSSSRYKDAFIPAAFPTALSLSFVLFPSLTFLHRPRRASGRAELHLLPTGPPSPHHAASEKNCRIATASSHSLDALVASSRWPPNPYVDPWQ